MKLILNLIISGLIIFSCWSAYQLHNTFKEEVGYKYDFAEIHKIKYGLFNLDIWKDRIFKILQKKVGTFELKSSDFDSIQKEVENYLVELHKDYFASGKIVEYIMKESKEDNNAVAKILMGLFKGGIEKQIEQIDFKSKIPGLARQLTKELRNKAPEIQEAIGKQISNMVASEGAKKLKDGRDVIVQKYDAENVDTLSLLLKEKIKSLAEVKKKWLTWSIGGLLLALILLLLAKSIIPFKLSMLWITVVSTVFLVMGLLLPMIDLDARLSQVDLAIMGESVHFDEQVMYFQSKSIIDVTQTLLEGSGIDLKLVGLLILLFSIVLPFAKMILTTVFLYMGKSRQSKLIKTIIFYLGKWSMADVFVVAIFMAYIGFYGLLSAQLGDMENQTDLYTLETVNYSKLSPGVIYFTLYVIFSILMSSLINRKYRSDADF